VAHTAAAAYPPAAAAAARRVITAVQDAENPSAREDARAALRSLDGRLEPARLALFHAAIGDREAALDQIERAYAEGEDPNFLLALVHPLFDPIRRDARFLAITRALGVEAPLAGRAAR
jgi:hypothetical protein